MSTVQNDILAVVTRKMVAKVTIDETAYQADNGNDTGESEIHVSPAFRQWSQHVAAMTGVPTGGAYESVSVAGPVEEFLAGVYADDQAAEYKRGARRIYAVINAWVANGEFGLVDLSLSKADTSRLGADLLFSFLTITHGARKRLTNRHAFLGKVYARVAAIRGEDVAKKLMAHMGD